MEASDDVEKIEDIGSRRLQIEQYYVKLNGLPDHVDPQEDLDNGPVIRVL